MGTDENEAVDNAGHSVASLIEMWGEDPTNPDNLLPELREYYEPDGAALRPILRSPLVYQVPFFYSWKMANMQYEAKVKQIKVLISQGKRLNTLWFYERPYRFPVLMEWAKAKLVSKKDMQELLPEVWIDTEHPFQFDYDELLKLFQRTGFVTDAPDHQPPDEPIIFRGCLPAHKKGMSWTFNPRKAAWFAQRFNGDKGRVYQAKITKDGILGIFLGRNEDEVVVDPAKLQDIRRMKEPDASSN